MIISMQTMTGQLINVTAEQLQIEIDKKISEGGQGKAVKFFRDILRRATYQTPAYKLVDWDLTAKVETVPVEGDNSIDGLYSANLAGVKLRRWARGINF